MARDRVELVISVDDRELIRGQRRIASVLFAIGGTKYAPLTSRLFADWHREIYRNGLERLSEGRFI